MLSRLLPPVVAAVTLAAVATAAPTPLLYVPFDTPQVNGGPGVGHQTVELTEGRRGTAAVLRSDCQFAVAGNFRVEAGTVAAWVRPHWVGTDTAPHVLFCLYGQRDGRPHYGLNRWTIGFGSGQCTFVIYSSTEGVAFAISAPVVEWKPGEWHHVAATWTGINSGAPDATMALFLDGTPVADLAGRQITVGPTDTVLAIGRDQDASPDYLDGDVDDLYIYGVALAPADIAGAVEAIRDGAVAYDRPAAVAAPSRQVAGWWNAAWPFRAAMVVPQAAPLDGAYQCPLRIAAEAAALAPAVTVVAESLRLIDAEGNQIPLRVEDGIAEWQQPGSGDTGAPTLYFQACTYEIEAPLISRRIAPSTATVAPATQPPAAPDYATAAYGKPWDFSDGTFCGIDQWGDRPEFVRNRKVENGILSMDVSVDPFFVWGDMWGQVDSTSRKVAIDLDTYQVLEMRLRQSVNSAVWELYGRVGASESLLRHKFTVAGKAWQRVRIDLRRDAGWHGVLSALRIDPTSGIDAHVEIDWIRLGTSTQVAHAAVEALGAPAAAVARLQLDVPQRLIAAGTPQHVAVTATDAADRPVAGQPVRVWLGQGSGGTLADIAGATSLELSSSARRGITDAAGRLVLRYTASRHATPGADRVVAAAEFASASIEHDLVVDTVPGPAHHYSIEPAKVLALRPSQLPLKLRAQRVDAFGNPVAGAGTLQWSTDAGGTLAATVTPLAADGSATTEWRGDEGKRWVYSVRVQDETGLNGESPAICLLPGQPRQNPCVLGTNGYFRQGSNGPAWLPLGGFYANWVGLPQDGEEGRRLISFVDATEAQLAHWLEYLAGQGVTSLRFMLRAHTPRGMEPLDVCGRVNMPLFARILRYLDMARKHDIRFMLVVHEDYTKPAYFNRQAFDTFCAPYYAGENRDALPPHQRRFVRDRRFIESIADKYTDPDAMACQDQYTRELFGLLKDNPQLFAWEFENEMVNCPESWSRHMAAVMRAADPVTPICASHGGGGLHTADPLWWTRRSGIDFYTYHLYPNRQSTSAVIDFGAAADILTCYGRMAGVCMFGETAGDEFGYYPKDRDAERRFIMRDLIWFALANGNPGCFFWNARGIEVEQFRLANRIMSGFDWREWKRQRPEVAVLCPHDWTDDKYYRSKAGVADYAMMGRYTQHFLSAGIDFDFALDNSAGYAKTVTLATFEPLRADARVRVGTGWQVRANAREGCAEGYAYVRNFAGTRQWREEGKGGMTRCDMFLRSRAPAPLLVRLDLPGAKLAIVATDLDTGVDRAFSVPGNGTIDLGVTDHDWAVCWRVVP